MYMWIDAEHSCIRRLSDNAIIPASPDNSDYQHILQNNLAIDAYAPAEQQQAPPSELDKLKDELADLKSKFAILVAGLPSTP